MKLFYFLLSTVILCLNANAQLNSKALSSDQEAQLDVPEEQAGKEVVFSVPFGGASLEDNTYNVASGSEGNAGFDTEETSIYLYSFPLGGMITFTAESASPVDLKFVFQRAVHQDAEASFETAIVTVDGPAAEYSVEVPSQDEESQFRSVKLFIITEDQAVTIYNVRVREYSDDDPITEEITEEKSTLDDSAYDFPIVETDDATLVDDPSSFMLRRNAR
jgi:hypothetical protein